MSFQDVTRPADQHACRVFDLGDDQLAAVAGLQAFLHVAPKAQPMLSVLDSFALGARTVVEEIGYFDMDTRSEVASLVGTAFGALRVQTSRLHFFRDAWLPEERARDFVVRAASSYKGYMVIRPSGPPIGRSIIPPTTSLGGRVDPVIAAEQIRTAVQEHVDLFGVPLVATGVPFMQQDGALLRCAHVSAWICHYAAVLRGAIARRESAYFHSVSGEGTRGYPSPGIKQANLERMLTAVDLPPVVLDDKALAGGRSFTWADRKHLRVKDKATLKVPPLNEAVWVAENLSAAVCRYLNSGLPVILARQALDHTQVVVGYLREKDFLETPPEVLQTQPWEPDADGRDNRSDVVAFIVSDDSRGPFEVVFIAQLVREILSFTDFTRYEVSTQKIPAANDDVPWAPTRVLIPLPRAMWLSGEEAEELATAAFGRYTRGRATQISDLIPQDLDQAFFDFAGGLETRNTFTVRVYASLGVDFKQSYAARVLEADGENNLELARRVGMVQLPRFVWVAEVLDRKARQLNSRRTVRATLVLDATITSERNQSNTESAVQPLFVQLPGHGFQVPWVLDLLGVERGSVGLAPAGPEIQHAWFPTSAESYATGRWSHERIGELQNRAPRQSKLAMPGR